MVAYSLMSGVELSKLRVSVKLIKNNESLPIRSTGTQLLYNILK